jgi:glycosyltransferase involved in cell wall biosynthesis
MKTYYEKDPKAYRDFKLHLVGIGKDYISQQVEWVGNSLLGKHLVIYPSVPKEEALEITSKCNAVICCSLNETFALYVAEGMLMGHVVLRNNSAGMDEQLADGKNGYFIDHTDVKQFAGVIEKLLNKKKTSDADLQKMGLVSQEMMQAYTRNSYLNQLQKLI